jgi:hypothetical protein
MIENLEQEYDKISNKVIMDLQVDELRTILAYHYQKDGATDEFIEEVWKTDPYWEDKEHLTETLTEIFGY